MCVETLRTVLVFPRQFIRGVTCLSLVEKWMFSHLCPWKPHKCVLKPSEQCLFFQDDRFEGSHAWVYSENECFPIYLLRNPINVCWNPQSSACFSKMIDLRGHMPRFTLKMNISHLSHEKPIKVCWNPQNSAHFSKTIDLRGHMPRFTLKWMFSHLSPEKPHKCVLKPSEQCLFFQDDQFEGSHA